MYLVLCVAGVVVPYWQSGPWVIEHGVNPALFVRELYANRMGAPAKMMTSMPKSENHKMRAY